jgi:hypothetical protein
MPIKTACPACAKVYTLADSLAGKQVRCKFCETAFEVIEVQEEIMTAEALEAPKRSSTEPPMARLVQRDEEEEEPRPRRRRSRDRDEEEGRPRSRRKRSDGAPTGLVIGLVASGFGLLLLIGIAVVFFAVGGGKEQPAPAKVPGAPIVPNNPLGQRPAGFPGGPVQRDWDRLQIGMTEQQVKDLLGQPILTMDNLRDIHVIHAHVNPDDVRGPDGRTKLVKLLRYHGPGITGMMDVTLVEGKLFKITSFGDPAHLQEGKIFKPIK